jgi:PUA-domain protein
MKRISLSKSEIKEINKVLNEKYNLDNYIQKNSVASIIETEDNKFLLVDNKIKFFYLDNILVPTLKILQLNNFPKKIAIDIKAVSFIVKGADVMRPGITEIEDGITKDSVVAIVDNVHKKAVAVGISLFSTEELRNMNSGKVIRNIHYVGDKIWNFEI